MDIRVPKLNNNDVSYVLVEWLVSDGEWVKPGTPVAVLETSKATEEIEAGGEGIVHQARPAGYECAVGEVIGHLLASEAEHRRFVQDRAGSDEPAAAGAVGAPQEPDTADVIVTEPARALASARGISQDQLLRLGKRVVRAADVEQIQQPDGQTDAETVQLNRIQAAVAAVVTESHRQIPTAYMVMRMPVDEALDRLRAAKRSRRVMVGLPELFVKAIGHLHAEFPTFFSELIDARTIRLGGAHVGVTIDVGTGLFVPVIRDAGQLALTEIGARLMELRLAAMRTALRESQVVGGRITLSLTTDDDVLLSQPIVFPGNVCSVSLSAVRSELVRDGASGEVREVKVVHVGASYDHRVINGREMTAFLTALRQLVTAPAELMG